MTTLLLIEDDFSLAQSLIELFADNGVGTTHETTLTTALTHMSGIDKVLSDWDLGIYESKNGGEIVSALRDKFPDVEYAIYSGLERRVPEGVAFFTKDRLTEIIRWVTS